MARVWCPVTPAALGWRLEPGSVRAAAEGVTQAAGRVIDSVDRVRRGGEVAAGGCGRPVASALAEFVEACAAQLVGESARITRSVGAAATVVAVYEAADSEMALAYDPSAFGPGRAQRLQGPVPR